MSERFTVWVTLHETQQTPLKALISPEEYSALRPNGRESVEVKLTIPSLSPHEAIHRISRLQGEIAHFSSLHGWSYL